MSKEFTPQMELDCSLYEIRLRGHLHSQWADWFDGFVITLEEDGTTLLRGAIVDQSALYGVLRRIRDLGIPLLSIMCVEYVAHPSSSSNDRS